MYKQGNVITFYGLSAAGKSTLVKKLNSILHTEQAPKQKELRRKKYSDEFIDNETQIKKQLYFLDLDEQISARIKEISLTNSYVFCDRDFFSALAHNYAEMHLRKDPWVYKLLVQEYCEKLGVSLFLSNAYFFLNVNSEERFERSLKDVNRKRAPLFFDDLYSYKSYLFYQNLLYTIKNNRVSVNIESIDYNELTIDEMSDLILDRISKQNNNADDIDIDIIKNFLIQSTYDL
jgi:thymidylate kinase